MPKFKKRSRLILRAAWILAAAASLPLAGGCSLLDAVNPTADATAGEPAVKTVRTEQAVIRQIEEPIYLTAEVVSSVQVDVSASISGTVEQVFKKIGDTVKEGETIARLSSEDVQFAYEQALEAVEQAKAGIRSARQELAAQRQEMSAEIRRMELALKERVREHNKTKNDYDAGLATKADIDRSAAELESYKVELQAVKRRLSQLSSAEATADLEARLADAELAAKRSGEALGRLEIKAPIDGVIAGLRLIEGLPTEGGEAAVRIERIDPVRIVAYLNEEGARLARGKETIRYALANSNQAAGDAELEFHEAQVVYLAGIADPERKTYTLELEVPNAEGQLKPGMRVSIELSDAITALTIPQISVVEEDGSRYAFVVENGVVHRRALTIGQVSPAYYEVLSGIREGERIVITGLNGLQDGEPVLDIDQPAPEGTIQ